MVVNNKDQIIGVIAYTISDYTYRGQTITGLPPLSWKVDPDHRGFAGIALMKRALAVGDFSFSMGGTDFSMKL